MLYKNLLARAAAIPLLAALLMAAFTLTLLAQSAPNAPTEPSRLGISAPRYAYGNGLGKGFYNVLVFNEGTEPSSSVLRLTRTDYTAGLSTSLQNCSVSGLVTTCPINRLTGVLTVAVTVTLNVLTDGHVDQCIYVDECQETTIRYPPWWLYLPLVID